MSLIHSDVLLLKNIRQILDDFKGDSEEPSVRVVANIPYNITSGAWLIQSAPCSLHRNFFAPLR